MAKTIDDYKKEYEIARIAGDAAAMKAANDGANAIRAANGEAAQVASADIAKVAAQSAKKNNSSFAGSATGVNTYTDDQSSIKAQMNANSQAWHTADDATKKQLEAQNKALAAQLGGSVGFDASTGTWSGTAAQPQAQNTMQADDLSKYLEDMYAAQKRQAIANLDAAYQSNLNAIDRAGAGVEDYYQAARNQTAGASEQAKRNFAEYAAASGLNNGTGGQAELARNVTLQNNLNTINTSEADTMSDLELQRANAEVEYNNAIAQAQAQGNYELAAALYQEKVRVQNLLLEQQQYQDQLALQQYQLNYQAQQDALDRQYKQNSALADYGSAFLNMGTMPSPEMLAAMGITAADAQNYITAAKAAAYTGKTGTGTPVAEPELNYNQMMSAIEDGIITPAVKDTFEDYFKVSYDDYFGVETPPVVESDGYTAIKQAALNLARNNYSGAEIKNYLLGRIAGGYITESEADRIAAEIMGGY